MALSINGTNGIEFNTDTARMKFGADDDMAIHHDNQHAYITNYKNNTYISAPNSVNIISTDTSGSSSETSATFIRNGAVELYYDNSKTLETVSGGAKVTGKLEVNGDVQWDGSDGSWAVYWDKSANGGSFKDNKYLAFGTSNDLKLYHDSSTNNIIENLGSLTIKKSDGDKYIHCSSNDMVELYHDGTKKFETQSGGAKVSGNLTLHTGTSSQIHFYDVNTHTITLYTSSNHFRWWSEVDGDAIAEISQAGNMNIDGSYSNSGVDYAEYFESTDGSAIPVGTTVVLDNGKVRAATGSETPIGVVRPKTNGTSVTGGVNELKWQGKYLTDDYDDAVLEDATFCTWEQDGESKQAWKDSGETIPADATETPMKRRKLNPDFDKSKTYVPRSQRTEWNCVGLLGQIPITKGQPTASNWIKMKERSSTVELWMVK